MKKTWTLLLSMLLILGLLAGCGGDAAVSAQGSAEPVSTEESTPEIGQTPGEAEPAREEAETSVPPEESISEEPVYTVTYPLTQEPVTLTLLHSEPMLGPLSGRCGVDSYGDVAGVQAVNEATGVSIEWNEMSMMTANEEFNLVVASGDYPICSPA